MSNLKTSSPVSEYLSSRSSDEVSPAMLGYVANLQQVAAVNAPIAASIVQELKDQRRHLKLIASENFTSLNTQAAMGNLLTDKYAEGFAGSRYYAGCDNIDAIETEACEQACRPLNAAHSYVQPHSGGAPKMMAIWAIPQASVTLPSCPARIGTGCGPLWGTRKCWGWTTTRVGT